MDTTFVNPENSKISEPSRPLLTPANKINLTRRDKYVVLSNLSI